MIPKLCRRWPYVGVDCFGRGPTSHGPICIDRAYNNTTKASPVMRSIQTLTMGCRECKASVWFSK